MYNYTLDVSTHAQLLFVNIKGEVLRMSVKKLK